MAKHIEDYIVKFVGYTEMNGDQVHDWHDTYMNTSGLLCVYESERKAPGKKFVYYFPNEPEEGFQRYFNSVSGEFTKTDDVITLEDSHRLVFEVGDFVPEDEKKVLQLNVGHGKK